MQATHSNADAAVPAKSGVRRVIVVGAGIAGLSIAWSLARRGIEVDLFEQGSIPNPKSSSFDEHRINRHAYGRLQGYARLMPESFRLWDAMWSDLGVRHYESTGGIYVLRTDDDWYETTAASLDEVGVDYHDIPLDQLERLVPMIEPEGVLRAVYVGGSGLLYPNRILTDLVVHLAARGVRFHAMSPVTEVDPERGEVTAGGKVHTADMVVVAAGAWIDRLVPSFRGRAVPSRQAVLFLAPPPDLAGLWASAPVIVVKDDEAGLYTLPPRNGTRLKIGDHRFSRIGDADEDRLATEADVESLWHGLRKCYRDIDRYGVLEQKACYYTVTDDENFLVRAIGTQGWAVSACSGHGFKLAPLVADSVARAIAGEASTAETERKLEGR
ncbi:NAD(P)/FAD-dependent oxidoreductase [Ancylobacter mangrovi]|uniref:NAD(P)/FAD-dependent oxidoreductase n=1 Tax=Ancylobacter mangrovi TaxID=2972472 RepID=UPI00216235FC|nr:FAD-dependent oxidoreductase [Ancylobacter mangrovi]MCS0502016.1 FAD-dependent oxidoreductase [Ancylobacter mangrovi]